MVDHLYHTDVVIIGAGPVGLFTIFQCGMMRLSCHVVDSLDSVGGQCAALYPEKPIYDIPGFPKINGQDLIDNLEAQAAPFKPAYHLGQQVTEVSKIAGDQWRIKTSKDTTIVAKAIIIAAGAGAFGPNRPPLEGLEAYEGKSIFYYVKRREDFRGKDLVIAGGGDSAVDWALSLQEVAKSITLVHRRPKFRASPESEVQLNELATAGKIQLAVPFQLEGLEGNDGNLTSVIVKSLDGQLKSLKADVLLPFYGLAMDLGPIAHWGLHLENKHITVDPLTSQTNEPGIFAVGDIATFPHKLKLILSGFAEAAQASHQARKHIYPEEVLHFEYSTTSGVPVAV